MTKTQTPKLFGMTQEQLDSAIERSIAKSLHRLGRLALQQATRGQQWQVDDAIANGDTRYRFILAATTKHAEGKVLYREIRVRFVGGVYPAAQAGVMRFVESNHEGILSLDLCALEG